MTNIILATDSYKLNHWNQYPENTEAVYSYFESRPGAQFPKTVFFGLQSILKQFFEGPVVRYEDLSAGFKLAGPHFGDNKMFNYHGWLHIIEKHNGKLPLRIKAVPEGTPVPTGNVLMTVENTDPECFWLTNAVESLLTHVWYPSTVASLSRATKEMLADRLMKTAGNLDALPFMLHDFGYRGATTHDAAAIGGAGHLVNFMGTDTLPAMELALRDYDADINNLAFSVPATEHSIMTALGEEGEADLVSHLLDKYPTGILSVVADSYNIYEFVDRLGTQFKDRILARDGVFVVRPDSITWNDRTPEQLTVTLLKKLAGYFGAEKNDKDFLVLNPKVRILWGDGIDPRGIEKILGQMTLAGFSAENIVFGMGGGLLQKVNRDTQRFAFKSSAQKRDGEWFDVCKEPLDKSKTSKKGRLRLERDTLGNYCTLGEDAAPHDHQENPDVLQTVFENGELKNVQTFEEIRKRAAL